MNDPLSKDELKILKELSKKYAFDVAQLKQAEVEGHAHLGPEYYTSRMFLHALLVMEMQEAMMKSVDDVMDKYQNLMGEDTMSYVLASTGLQYFAAMTGMLMDESPDMAEQLLDECMIHYEDLCEEAGMVDILSQLGSIQEEPAGTPAEQLKTVLTLVKGNVDE